MLKIIVCFRGIKLKWAHCTCIPYFCVSDTTPIAPFSSDPNLCIVTIVSVQCQAGICLAFPAQTWFNTQPKPKDPKILKDSQFWAQPVGTSDPLRCSVFLCWAALPVPSLWDPSFANLPRINRSEPFIISAILYPLLICPETTFWGLWPMSLSKRKKGLPEWGSAAANRE